jgi:hypothetical protein
MVLLIFFLGLLLVTALVGIPGTNITLEQEIFLIFIPLAVLLSLASIGAGFIKFHRNGIMVIGWIAALLVSLTVGLVTANRVLLTYRHPQYLMAPLALCVGLGGVMMVSMVGWDRGKRMIAALVIVVLLGLSAYSAYPPKDLMGGFQEGTSHEDMQAVLWSRYSLPKTSTVASDHRMSSMLFGFAELNATWDAARKTLHAPTYQECRNEIALVKTPSGDKSIDYILLDEDIKEGAALLQWENAEPMSTEAREKFQKWPFVKLYEAGGVEVYGIVE